MRIRACGPDDAAALALVGAATFLETYAELLPGVDIVAHCREAHAEAAYAAALRDPDVEFRLAETTTQGAPAGYLMLGPPTLDGASQSDLEVRRIYVLARFQGAGAGARLMAEAIAAGKRRGAARLWLGVKADNLPAQGFYARQGFVQAGVRRFRVGANTYDDLVLALGL